MNFLIMHLKQWNILISLAFMMVLPTKGLGLGQAWIQLPVSYTAMKGDVVVSFDLMNSSQINAVVHIESIESGGRLAELPIPIGLISGAVIFPCGVIVHGGPHKAVLSRGGQTLAESPFLNVLWPAVRLDVPSRLETFESDVVVKVSFTANICAAMSKRRDEYHFHRRRDVTVPFRVFLHLVKCKSFDPQLQDESSVCNLPNDATDERIWFTSTVSDDFYRHSFYKIKLNCSLWSEDGSYRVFITSNLTSSKIIGSSSFIKVVTNKNFALDSFFTAVLPCETGDIKPIAVSRPVCSPHDDRVRAYAQEHQIVGGNIIPTDWRYLGEVKIISGENLAVFPCEMLNKISNENILEVCFHYITSSIVGTTYNPVSLCLPTTVKDARRPQPDWGEWNSWSDCSVTCGNDGTQFRVRFCQTSGKPGSRMLCKGQPVDYKMCGGPPCPQFQGQMVKSSTHPTTEKISNIWKPLPGSESSSPCWCGCIYVVSRIRELAITSGPDCPSLPLLWRLRVSNHEKLKIKINLIEFSCSNSIFHLRDGGQLADEIIYETESDVRHVVVGFNSTAEVVGVEFMAPRRSCRINLHLTAYSISNTAVAESHSSNKDYNWWAHLYFHLPLALILILSFMLVTLLSSVCLGMRFEWQRRKYVAWKTQPSSGYSTPNLLDQTSMRLEDINTSTDDIPLLLIRKKKRGKGSRDKLVRAARIIRNHFSRKRSKPAFRSLPSSPYMTRRTSLDSVKGIVSPINPVSGLQVRRAAHNKSLRYQKGDFSLPNRRPKPPTSSPTKRWRQKRLSRSLTDIVGILSFNCPDGMLLKEEPKQVGVTDDAVRPESSLKSVHFSSYQSDARNHNSKKLMEKRLKLNRLSLSTSNSTLGGKSLEGSNDTLKAAGSMSEFSQHSGDPELEFDLYDCDLNNASAVPGSYFAHSYNWGDCDYDMTPTGEEEEMELSDFFPGSTMLRNHPKCFPTDSTIMNESRTSDLTASLTSADDYTLRMDSSCFSNNYDTDEDDIRETDTLIKKPHLLNFTHIDEISYVDEENLPLKV